MPYRYFFWLQLPIFLYLAEGLLRAINCGEDWFRRLELPTAPSSGAHMDVTMVGNLPHYVVDDELPFSVFLARNEAEGLNHERSLLRSWSFPMFA